MSAIILTGAFSACSTNGGTQKKEPRKVAVQTYTFNQYTLEETVGHLKVIGIDAIECWNGQRLSAKYPNVKFNQGMNAEQRKFAKEILKGFKLISYGVINANNEAELKSICEFAKEFSIPMIITEAPKDQLPLWEKYCQDYNLKMAIHDHQKGSGNEYYRPELVMELVKDYKNIGICCDNGAWSRSGLDCVKSFKIVEGKIFEIHFKDQKVFDNLQSPATIYGQGVLDMKGMLAELDRQGYNGYFVIEHGDKGDTPAIVKADLEFLRNN